MKEQQIMDVRRMEWSYRPNSVTGKVFGQKPLVEDKDMEVSIVMNRYPAGFQTVTHTHPCGHGLYILEGQIKTNGSVYGPETLIWYPEGCVAEHGATQHDDATVLLISNKAFSIHYIKDEEEKKRLDKGIQPVISDVGRMPWFYRMASTTGKMFGKKQLHLDEATGMQINYINYPAGFTTDTHTHPSAHGLFVLSGQLKSNDEYFGPGTMVWYEEGCIAEHGATAHEDLICLQISNKDFSIEYRQKDYQKIKNER